MDVGEEIKQYLFQRIDEFRKESDDYYTQVTRPIIEEAYDLYNADKEYYKKKFPRISKSSNLVSTDVADTIEWALPSLMKIFMGSDEVVQIEGAEGEDERPAEVMKKLINYQLQRKNPAFTCFYNWFKDSLITGVGILKCYWERQTGQTQQTQIVNQLVFQQMQQQGMQIINAVPVNQLGDLQVTFVQEFYNKNQPKIENIVPSEFRFSPGYKSLEECPFIAHKKRVTLSYLRQREKEGIFANIDKVAETSKPPLVDDPIDQGLRDNYYVNTNKVEESAKEFDLWECYVRLDINEDGIAEDIQVFLVEDTFIRIEENIFERSPFFLLSPMKDPHRIWPKKSYSKLIGELQDLKIALIRQVMINIAKSNDPVMIMSEDAINIQDYIEGRLVLRKKPGFSMSDCVQPMPPIQLHPWTFNFLEYVETQKENRTGITRYNQGLDARSLNKMLSLDTPIPMADGSIKINADIIEGDLIVGSDGKPTKVIQAHPVQMPQRAFRMEFQNGDIIKSGGEHRWAVKVSNKNYKNKLLEWEKLPAERIYELFQSKHNIFIPRAKAVDYPKQNLIIDPYVFGAWLGDGHAHTNRFTSMDEEIITAFSNWSKQFYKGHIKPCKGQNSGKATTYSIVNTPFRKMLKDLGCLKDTRYEDTKDNVKHIPEIYLKASLEQRLALLHGLMDTDGHITKNGNSIFCNSEPVLIEDFVKLVGGLGGKTKVHWSTHTQKQFPDARPHAHVTFALPFCPVTVKHKVERWHTRDDYWEQVKIKNIEEIPVELMRCLTVDAEDELYCCGNHFTVTANTASGISQIMSASNQRLELISRIFAETGIKDLYRFLVALNQKFVDQNTVIRLTNEQLTITPEDLQGDFDLVVNTGVGITTKETTMMNLQTLLTVLMQVLGAGFQIVTPQNVYYIMKRFCNELGMKNTEEYLTDPMWLQQMQQMVQMALFSMAPPQMQQAIQQGGLTPEIVSVLPPPVQQLLQMMGVMNGQQGTPQGNGPGGSSSTGSPVSAGVVGQQPRGDNRTPQNVPRQ